MQTNDVEKIQWLNDVAMALWAKAVAHEKLGEIELVKKSLFTMYIPCSWKSLGS